MNNNDITKLFKLVWNNIYIKSNIFKHLKIFNLYYSIRNFNSYNDYINFKYKYYLYEIEIGNLIDENINLEIPYNIEAITINYNLVQNKRTIKSFKIPSNIKSLILINWPDDVNELPIEILNNNNNNNLKKVEINFQRVKQLKQTGLGIFNNSLDAINYSSNLTQLNLYENIHLIKNGSLPNNLKILNIMNYINNHSTIEKGSLPKSLTELNIMGLDIIEFENDYLPDGLIKLNLNTTSGWFTVTNDFKFPKDLKQFSIDCKVLNFEIPKQIESLSIRIAFFINSSYEYLNKMISSVNLKSLSINLNTFYNLENQFIIPKFLKKLIISSSFNEKLKSNGLSNLKHLEYLEFNNSDSFLEILYPSDSGFNNGGEPLIENNIFPISLTYIDFGDYFNQRIEVNVLPINLKTLKLGKHFNCEIVYNSIPYNLNLLVIRNQDYSEQFKLLNPMTLVDSQYYYRHLYHEKEQIYSYKHPFNSSNYEFHIENAINLQYLDLSNYSLNSKDIINYLPNNNQIKTIVFNDLYTNSINIEDFKQLETIIIKGKNNGPNIQTSVITTTNFNLNNDNQIKKQEQNISYNFYNLKQIHIDYKNITLINKINPIFYQFIKLE